MTIDYTAINAALFNRVATASAGSTVRALAASGQNNIFQRFQLKSTAGRVFPWLVWSEIDTGGESGDMRPMVGSWWLYVAPPPVGSLVTLQGLASALETLYGGANELAIADGRVKVVHRSRSFEDKSLTAIGMEVRISYSRRG